jgi:anaerobic selenocysteine-containing dehydrogenase
MKVAARRLRPLFRQANGPLTQELVLEPGRFGLGKVPVRLAPDDVTSMVCGFCSTGCALNVHLRKGAAINITPTTDYPVNLGMACPKGWEALTPLAAADRATTPLLRDARVAMRAVDWDTAMQVFTLRLKAIQDQHGPESVAWLGSGQITTEELAFLGALGKFGMGILHGDGNTRQCMATSVTAYKESFGFDAPPFAYGDLEESDVLVFIGSNLCIAHPILWQRVLRNPNKPEIIVIDPRRTETAAGATRHYAIQPKSDLKLLYGLANVLIARGWIDGEYIEKHTEGFDEFAKHVRAFDLHLVCAETGLTRLQVENLASIIYNGERVSFWWTMGVNQGHEATRTAQAIINLALMTGNMGRPGTGANSITGQCNAMGSRLFSNTTNLLGGHDFRNATDREKVAGLLGIPVGRIPSENSLAYDQILDGVEQGKIKALWIIGTNPMHSWIESRRLRDRKLFRKLDFLVVQDMYHSTETAREAHLLLPAAAWGEKDGTFINSERRLGLIKKVSFAPGQALSDFNIFRLIAHYWGCGEIFREWTSPEAVFQIIKRVSRGQPCDITGIRDYRMIDEAGGIQWPLPEGVSLHCPERRLFEDGRFYRANGRAKFVFADPAPVPEAPCREYPLILLTGRGSSAQWHTQTRTDKSDILRQLYPREIYVEVNPIDAREAGVKSHELVSVESRRGAIKARAVITATIAPGQIFVPMHYGATNQLTLSAFDPDSRQPAYKACAARIRVLKDRAGKKRGRPSRWRSVLTRTRD